MTFCPLTSVISPSPPETHTPQRKGLRSSALRPKKPEPAKQTGPVVIETWVAEEELDLWEIRAFSERWDITGSQRLKRNMSHLTVCSMTVSNLLATCLHMVLFLDM